MSQNTKQSLLYWNASQGPLHVVLQEIISKGKHIIHQVIITNYYGGLTVTGHDARKALIIINEEVEPEIKANLQAPMFTILRSLKKMDMIIFNDEVYHVKDYANDGKHAFIVSPEGDAPVKVLIDNLSLPLRQNSKVTLKSENNKRLYDFGYYSSTKGHAVCYEEGERNMQDSFSTLISNIQPFIDFDSDNK